VQHNTLNDLGRNNYAMTTPLATYSYLISLDSNSGVVH
jgi:hypothetical protein